MIVYEIEVKLVSKWEQNMLYTGLDASSLACKCLFYRPEHNAKVGPYGTKF